MARYTQTLARIGAGLSTLGTLIWLLWPEDLLEVLDPEPLFAFAVALVFWVFTEIKTSEEAAPLPASPNDVRNARDLLRMQPEELRVLLEKHDTFQFLIEDYYSLVRRFLNRRETQQFVFQNKILEAKLEAFCSSLSVFNDYVSLHADSDVIAGVWRTGFKPRMITSQEEYDRLFSNSRVANDYAYDAWEKLTSLCTAIHKLVPEALNEPLLPVSWFEFQNR